MAPKNMQADEPQTEPADRARADSTNLSGRYGKIGIDAVAAAVRYADPKARPHELVSTARIDQRFVEAAG